MNNREFGNTDPDFTINQLLSQDQSLLKHNLGQINIKHVRERFSKALNEITRLEKIIEDKNTLLATSAKEKERLLHTLNKAIADKERLHNKFVDFDVLRNMEIAEVKQSAEKMVSKINHLRKETNELIDDIFEKDKTIEEMKHTIEKKELQLRDVQADLDVAIETLRGEEYRKLLDIATSEKEMLERRLSGLREQRTKEMSEYQATIERLTAEKDKLNLKLIEATKDVALSKEENAAIEALRESEANHRVIEQERDNLKEQLKIIVHDSIQKSEAEAEHRKKIKELNNTIAELNLRLTESNNPPIPPFPHSGGFAEEKEKGRELSADKKMLYFKDKTVSQKFPEKMIYIAPSKFGWIKKVLQARLF